MPAHRASGARRFSATDQPPEAPRSLALGITLLRFRLLIPNYSSYEKTGYYFSVTSFTYVPDSSSYVPNSFFIVAGILKLTCSRDSVFFAPGLTRTSFFIETSWYYRVLPDNTGHGILFQKDLTHVHPRLPSAW